MLAVAFPLVARPTTERKSGLSAYAGLSSRLWVVLQAKWQIEVVLEGRLLPPYQAAALTAAHQAWTA